MFTLVSTGNISSNKMVKQLTKEAIHLNVDPSGKIKTLFRRKVLWSFIALFSPEIVVLSAYQQWFQTKELQAKFDKYKQNESMEQQIEEGETFSCMKRHRKDMSVSSVYFP